LITQLSQQKPDDEYSKVAINRLRLEVLNAVKRFKNCYSKYSQVKVVKPVENCTTPKYIPTEIPQVQQQVVFNDARYSCEPQLT
jgi:hypothetical protein